MTNQGANQYLRTKVLTATPEQLQLMLYDGAIRFAEQARLALQKKDFEGSYNGISRAQKIIAELSCALRLKRRRTYVESCPRFTTSSIAS